MSIDAALGRLGNKSGVCTSSTRPTNPFEGQLIYETDTNRTLVYDNAAWLVVADNQVLSIDSANGRVGVGTTAPETPLTIDTTNKLGSSFTGNTAGEGLRVVQTNYASGNYVSLVEGTYDDFETAPNVRIGAMYDGGGSQLSFGTSNSYGSGITNEALAITSEGNVGVNDISPSYTLDVNGDINATGDLRIGGTAVGAWTAFTPSWFNVTVGNAIQKAYYSVVNEIVHVAGEFVFNSTSTFTGSIGFASPVTVNGTVMGNYTGIGQVIVNGNQFGFAQRFNNDIYFYWLDTAAAVRTANMPNMNATGPKTFTTGDDIRWYLTYATT